MTEEIFRVGLQTKDLGSIEEEDWVVGHGSDFKKTVNGTIMSRSLDRQRAPSEVNRYASVHARENQTQGSRTFSWTFNTREYLLPQIVYFQRNSNYINFPKIDSYVRLESIRKSWSLYPSLNSSKGMKYPFLDSETFSVSTPSPSLRSSTRSTKSVAPPSSKPQSVWT